MKTVITPASRGTLIIYRVVVALILLLAVVLITGSLYAAFRPKDSPPLFRIGGAGGDSGKGGKGRGEAAPAGDVHVFSGIGRLRIPLAGETSATVIIAISFPYPADDRAFAEELASRIGDFRSIAREYFASLSPEKAAALNEEEAKAEILKSYNTLLRLGKIETLYFGDLMVVD
jgi:flagellar basal body-associated protein FliL